MTITYPPLRAAVLHGLSALKEAYDLDETVLDQSGYDAETIAILKKMFQVKVIEKEVVKEGPVRVAPRGRGRPTKDVQLGEDDIETVRTNVTSLLEELENMSMDKELPTNERIQITKTKANLVEQLLKMKERNFNVKQMSEFQTIVIGILEDLVSEKDRDIFLQRIDAYRD